MRLAVLTLNIASPSFARAERLLAWLGARDEHVLVLTETSDGKGTALIAQRLAGAGWDVRFRSPKSGERGTLIAARVALEPADAALMSFLPARTATAIVAPDALQVIGVYVPSRDSSVPRIERKQRFVDEFSAALAGRRELPTVLLGDLNVLEPGHRPRRPEFLDWEYALYDGLGAAGWEDAYRLVHPTRMEHSWVGPDNDGYRFDHIFVSRDLAEDVEGCGYVHETRKQALTDHSGMVILLSGIEADEIEVDASLTEDERALF